jgi:signal transduction histidine kinase
VDEPNSVVPTALAALSVAHLVAARHTDPEWRSRLFMLASGLVVVIVLLSLSGSDLALPLTGLVALIPGIPVAFADRPGDPQAIAGRLETLAVALTPGAAATVLLPGGVLILGGWLAALIIWRYFTLGPLIGFAQRTQLQRDLAVAAAETERARLAADLHDDALQQLTMLVRTLDDAGHADAASQAREVATKLRAVVGDLRLPILDDLGAGAALEPSSGWSSGSSRWRAGW